MKRVRNKSKVLEDSNFFNHFLFKGSKIVIPFYTVQKTFSETRILWYNMKDSNLFESVESKKLNDNRSRHVSLILDYLKKVVVSKEYQPFISPKAIYRRVFNKDLKSTLSSSLRRIPQAKYALELRSDCILNFVDNINTFDYSLDSDTLGAKYHEFINSSQYLSSPKTSQILMKCLMNRCQL